LPRVPQGRRVICIGLDPGKRSPAHVLCHDADFLLSSNVPLGEVCPVFVESQYPGSAAGKQSLLSLGFAAGLHAGAYLAAGNDVYMLPVTAQGPNKIRLARRTIASWRQAFFDNGAAWPKPLFHSRAIAKGLVPSPVISAGPDTIDAYLIAQAGLAFLREGYTMKKLSWLNR